MEIGVLPTDAAAGFNYGLDKVRFPAPVKAGARVRLRVVLVGVEPKDAGQLIIKMRNTMEIDGSDKPAVVAETLALLVPGKAADTGEPR
jgi:acyl dehydratase